MPTQFNKQIINNQMFKWFLRGDFLVFLSNKFCHVVFFFNLT